MSKKIRSKAVNEPLWDYETLTNSLKENTESAVKNLLGEAVRDTYAKLLSEDDNDEEYNEEEVEDTDFDTASDDAENEDVNTASDDKGEDEGSDNLDSEGSEETLDNAGMDAESDGNTLEDNADGDTLEDNADGDDEWAEFDKYKVSDDEYDFSNAEDEEIVKVYKLMKDDDQILVHKDDEGKVNLKDNETGAEYLIDLGSDTVEEEDDFGAEDDLNNELDNMDESNERLFELVLEYDSNVGYTDNYQKKDVMTNPGMSEPGKNVNDWDAGVPKGDKKPWSGYPGKKNKADKPFNAGKGKTIEEEDDAMVDAPVEECGDMEMTEGAARYGMVQKHTKSKKHIGTNPEEKEHIKVQHSDSNSEDGYKADNISENLKKRINKTLKENKELKETLTGIMKSLKEAAVTNHNLAQIIKLISENATSQDEKKEIIARFAKEGKTIEASKNLYESINNDLKKSNKMNLTEDKSLTVESSKKINETPIYKSQDIMESLDLMHRMNRI